MAEFSINVTEMDSQMSQLRGQCSALFTQKARVSSAIIKLRGTPNSVASGIRQRLGYESNRISKEINNIYAICGAGGQIVSAVKKADNNVKHNLETNFKEQLQEILRNGFVHVITTIRTVIQGLIELYKKAVKAIADWFKRIQMNYISDEQKKDIQDIVDKAKEPYKSIYEKNKDKYKIGNARGKDTGYYSPGKNTVNVDVPNEPNNPRGAYTTWFHENGHAIDYNYNNDGNYYSLTYRNSKGESLQDLIYADVRNDVTNTVSQYASGKTAQHVVDYIMGAKNVDFNSLSKAEQRIVQNVQSYYKKTLSGAVNEAPSDVYGGVTNNILDNGYGHRPKPEDAGKPYTYWYDTNGNATGAQSKELWAEYYSYAMTGNEAAMNALRQKFPSASKMLDEIAASMK